MSLTTQGYLEQPYLSAPYATTMVDLGTGFQVEMVIAADKKVGSQASMAITANDPTHTQVARTIVGATKATGSQVNRAIASSASLLQQVSRTIANSPAAIRTQVSRTVRALLGVGLQVDLVESSSKATRSQVSRVSGTPSPVGVQVSRTESNTHATGMSVMGNPFVHMIGDEYLVKPYLSTPYLANDINAHGRMQVLLSREQVNTYGTQVQRVIRPNIFIPMQVARSLVHPLYIGMQVQDYETHQRSFGSQAKNVIAAAPATMVQVLRTILAVDHIGMQVNRVETHDKSLGSQVQRVIDATKRISSQVRRVIQYQTAFHSQARLVHTREIHMQSTMVLYNTTNLRILKDFPSRGTTGTNWAASSTQTGDFNVNNLNNDIVEFLWRSADGDVGVVDIACDTQIPQGVFVDTIGILNHNLTKSAVVFFQGTNDPTFSSVGMEVSLNVSLQNMYYIAPTLPPQGFRYYRLRLEDPTNPNGFLSIGTVVFGSSIIFVGDDIVDQIGYSKKHFKDSIPTEGYTAVNNDRALRKTLKLSFKDLDFQRGNYLALSNLFDTARTSLKCLWIPAPKYPTRFAIFGKLVQLPEETHNDKGASIDYIDLSVEIDESL